MSDRNNGIIRGYNIGADLGTAIVSGRLAPTDETDGVLSVAKFGSNPDVDSGTDEDCWSAGGDYEFQASAQTIEVLSDSANDTAAGTGAKTIRVFGLDANWELQEEDVTLNGTTPVTLGETYLRIFRAYVLTAGTIETNDGTITIRTDGLTTQAEIPAGRGQTLMAIYTIPEGYTGYITAWYGDASKSSTGIVTARLMTRENGGAWRNRSDRGIHSQGGGFYQPKVPQSGGIPIKVNARTDVKIRYTDASTNNLEVTGGFNLLLTKD